MVHDGDDPTEFFVHSPSATIRFAQDEYEHDPGHPELPCRPLCPPWTLISPWPQVGGEEKGVTEGAQGTVTDPRSSNAAAAQEAAPDGACLGS